MGMAPARPEAVKSFADTTPPCAQCDNCVLTNTRSGSCVCPDNKQGSEGPIPEFITDVTQSVGHCGGFVYRGYRVSA